MLIDAETTDSIYLLKKVSCLRATYQVRLAAHRAERDHKRLIIRAPKDCVLHPSLIQLVAETGPLIQIETL